MTKIIMLSVAVGIAVGYFFIPEFILGYTGYVIDVGLCLMLFFVGMDLGRQKGILEDIKKVGFTIFIVPIMTAIGTIFGSALAGMILKMPIKEAAAVGAGFGWYTFSAVALADYSAELGAAAFISNILRELFAILIIPVVASRVGYLEAIAPAGATAMDTVLPVVARYTDSKIAIFSFVSGCVLSLLVPILVPFIINL